MITNCGHFIQAEFVPAAIAAVIRVRTYPTINKASRLALKRNLERGDHDVEFGGDTYEVGKNVFSPAVFAESATFTNRLAAGDIDLAGKDMLEVGSGNGMTGLHLAKYRHLKSLTAIDINPDAATCTQRNAEKLGLQDKVTVLQGDVYTPLSPAKRFDITWWAYPWSAEHPASQCSLLERSVFDPGYKGLDRYIGESGEHRKPGGRTFIGFGDFGDSRALRKISNSHGYEAVEIFRGQPARNKKYNIHIYELLTQG